MICDLKSNSLKIFDLIYCCSCPHPSVLSNKLNQWWSGQQPAGSLLPAACKCVQSEASLKPLELNHYINPVCQFRDNLSCCCLLFTPAACVEDTAWTRKLPKPKACLLSSWRYAGLARGLLERALTFGYVSYHSWCWLTLPIVAYSRISFSGGFMRVYVQFMGIRGTEKKNSLEAQDNLLRISANISRCTTRLNTPVFPIGAGSLEQGHGSTKSREKNNNWAVRVADKMAIRKKQN